MYLRRLRPSLPHPQPLSFFLARKTLAQERGVREGFYLTPNPSPSFLRANPSRGRGELERVIFFLGANLWSRSHVPHPHLRPGGTVPRRLRRAGPPTPPAHIPLQASAGRPDRSSTSPPPSPPAHFPSKALAGRPDRSPSFLRAKPSRRRGELERACFFLRCIRYNTSHSR